MNSFRQSLKGLVCAVILTVVNPFSSFSMVNSDDDPVAEYVIMIIIDGIRYDHGFGSGTANMPYLYGVLGPQASINTSFYTDTTPSTNSGHSSMVTGTWQVLRNDGSERPTLPTFFEYLRQERGLPAEACHVVTGKDKLDILTHCSHPNFGPDYGGVVTTDPALFNSLSSTQSFDLIDINVYENTLDVLQNQKPQHMVISFPAVDLYGHAGRFDDYIRAIRQADSLIYNIWQYLQSDPFYAGKTVMTVTNDHGRHDDSHGGYMHHGCGCHGCRHIMFLAIGPGIKMNVTTDVRRTLIDILPTAAELLGGFENPYWQGKVMKEILDFEVIDPVFVPPTANGTIANNEYGVHFDGVNMGASSSQRWYMTYDNNNLYIGISGANTNEGAVFYIDIDPLVPINGGGNSNGNFVGQSYDGTNFEKLPFRADYVAYFKNSYREIRQATGTGGWSSAKTNFGTYGTSGGGTRELIIPWTEFGFEPGTRPDKFAWIGYVAYPSGGVYGQIPRGNPSGGNVMRPQRYFIVDTTGEFPDPPFSKESYVYNRAASSGNITNFRGIDVYDFTLNSPGRGITRSSDEPSAWWTDDIAWNIRGDLRIDAGFINFGGTGSGAVVQGNVYIGEEGSLTLSTKVGGDLDIRGNWLNNGTFNGNNRQIEFRGIREQNLNQKELFDYMYVANAEGLSFADSLFVTKRIILGAGPVKNSPTSHLVISDDVLVRRETGYFEHSPVYLGDVRLEYGGFVQVETGHEVPDFPVKEFTLNNTAGITIGSGNPVLVKDRLRLTAGTLTVPSPDRLRLLSTADGTARTSGNGTVSGDYTMQRYLKGQAGWRMMASPLGSVTLQQLASELPIQGFPGANPGHFKNLYTGFDGQNWLAPDHLNTSVEAGQAFLIYLFNNNTGGSRELPFTMELHGREPSSDVVVPLHQDGSKWNFIGNPFSSGIDVRLMQPQGGTLTSTVGLIWNSGEIHDEHTVNGTWVLTSTIGHILAPWQGMILNNNDASTLLIPRSSRAGGDAFQKTNEPEERLVHFRIDAVGTEGVRFTDQSLALYFHKTATFGTDSWDVSKIPSFDESFVQIAFGESGNFEQLRAQESLPYHFAGSVQRSVSIISNGFSGEVTLSWPTITHMEGDMDVRITDQVTGHSFSILDSESYTFTHQASQSGKPRFTLQISGTGTTDILDPELPLQTELFQNYPNPFNPSTTIRFQLSDAGRVSLAVYDILGRKVADLKNEWMTSGSYDVNFDASSLSSGVYIYRLEAGGQVLTRKMTMLK